MEQLVVVTCTGAGKSITVRFPIVAFVLGILKETISLELEESKPYPWTLKETISLELEPRRSLCVGAGVVGAEVGALVGVVGALVGALVGEKSLKYRGWPL